MRKNKTYSVWRPVHILQMIVIFVSIGFSAWIGEQPKGLIIAISMQLMALAFVLLSTYQEDRKRVD